MSRLRYNNAVGTLGASLTSSGTTITFASAPAFATITSPDFIPLVLEPAGSSPSANFEIVYLTAYTAGQTTGTILRGQEGTTAVAHSSGAAWVCGVLSADLSNVALVPSTGYTLFVNRALGSDSNAGTSLGTPLATLGAAVALLNASTHGGRIVFDGFGVGPYSASAPIHLVREITLEGCPTHDTELDRTFTTLHGRSVWDAVTTAAGSSVSSATAAFTNADNGRIVSIYGAGSAGGTFYDFINGNPPSGTTANLTATTAVARNSTTDPKGVKMSIVGDWNRLVTDAAITSGQSTVTSATAAWTNADIGTEIVVAGAGVSGQALRAAILSVQSSTQCTIVGKAGTTVSAARCAIGVIFGDLITAHVSGCGLKRLTLADTTTGNGTIGAAFKGIVDQGIGIGTGALVVEDVVVSSNDASGAWEHTIEIDGSWNQSGGGPGFRQVDFRNLALFGARKALENIRIVNGVHISVDGWMVSAPLSSSMGIVLLDPQHTGGGLSGGYGTVDVHFDGFEHIGADFYCEGQPGTCGFLGGRIGAAIGAPEARIMALRYGTDVVVRQSFDRQYGQASATITSGTLWAATVPVLAGDPPLGHVAFYLASGATLGTNGDSHWYVALYDPSGNLIVQSADQGAAALGGGIHNLALQSNYLPVIDQNVTVALMVYVGTGGTPAAPVIGSSPGSDMGQLLSQWARCGVLGNTGQTSGTGPATFTVSATPSKTPWFALHP